MFWKTFFKKPIIYLNLFLPTICHRWGANLTAHSPHPVGTTVLKTGALYPVVVAIRRLLRGKGLKSLYILLKKNKTPPPVQWILWSFSLAQVWKEKRGQEAAHGGDRIHLIHPLSHPPCAPFTPTPFHSYLSPHPASHTGWLSCQLTTTN